MITRKMRLGERVVTLQFEQSLIKQCRKEFITVFYWDRDAQR
ncbi:MAG: hypothetical protein U0517_00215 [Candidatus Andersenbacteria bacterium]